MKHFTPIILATGIAMLCSCNKSAPAPMPEPESGKVALTISVGEAATKVFNPMKNYENAVRSVQILVFNETGGIEAYAGGTSTGSYVVGVPAGVKTVWAVANSGRNFSDVTSLAEFEKTTVDLSENSYSASIGGFVMAGKTTQNVSVNNDNITVDISHLTAKVVVDRISKQFRVDALKHKKISLKGIYIINAVDKCTLSGVPAPEQWYNRMSFCDEPVRLLLGEKMAATTLIDEQTPFCPNGGVVLYPYPNSSTSESTSSEWSPRKSMLVVDVTMDTERFYYPVFIKSLEAGKIYEFTDIVLTRRGSPDPYVPVSAEDISLSVRVVDYVTGESYMETI